MEMAAEFMIRSVNKFDSLSQYQMEQQYQWIYPYTEMQNNSELTLIESKLLILEAHVLTLTQDFIHEANLGYYPEFDFAQLKQQLDQKETTSPNLIIANLEEERINDLKR